MTDERITQHLEYLQKYFKELKELRKYSEQDFFNDDIKIFAAERLFQTAIEACINIGNRIISIEQITHPLLPPEKYSDIALRLRQIEVIDQDFEKIFINMIKFRNKLVHIYWEIDREELFSYLKNDLKDFDRFISFVIDYLNKSDNK